MVKSLQLRKLRNVSLPSQQREVQLYPNLYVIIIFVDPGKLFTGVILLLIIACTYLRGHVNDANSYAQ